jgi:hypothetical protein
MFSNRIVTDLGMGRCEPAVGGFSAPRMSLGSGHLFSGCRIINLAVKPPSFRVETSDEAGPASANPSSRSRAFVISARPNCRGFGPGPSLNVPIAEHKP